MVALSLMSVFLSNHRGRLVVECRGKNEFEV